MLRLVSDTSEHWRFEKEDLDPGLTGRGHAKSVGIDGDEVQSRAHGFTQAHYDTLVGPWESVMGTEWTRETDR